MKYYELQHGQANGRELPVRSGLVRNRHTLTLEPTRRRFTVIRRSYEPSTGVHILDAIAHDGTAWWMRLGDGGWEWKQTTDLPELY